MAVTKGLSKESRWAVDSFTFPGAEPIKCFLGQGIYSVQIHKPHRTIKHLDRGIQFCLPRQGFVWSPAKSSHPLKSSVFLRVPAPAVQPRYGSFQQSLEAV
jgi:hypothetical protein